MTSFNVTAHKYSTVTVEAEDEDEARLKVERGDFDPDSEDPGSWIVDEVEEADEGD